MEKFQPQYLEQGKILSGKAFPNFVRTWNWLVDFVRNLTGDAENVADGAIVVDRADPSHPVIRTVKRNETGGSGGGGKTYVCGADSNIVFTDLEDGTTSIDVYYV